MAVNDLFAGQLKSLGNAKATISTATTTNFSFGSPSDINLASVTGLPHPARVLVKFSATTSGTTDTVSFSVQDAPDSSGSIGTPATAITDGTLSGGTGDQYAVTTVQIQPGRPWLRFRVTQSGATDTHACTVQVYALPAVI